MVKINRKVEYALIILRHMQTAGPEGRVTAKEMEEKFGLSFDVTSKVMQALGQAGVLTSAKGAHGGYRLVRDLDQLSFHDLHALIQGPMSLASCLHEEGSSCDLTGGCNIIAPIVALNEQVNALYKNLKVAELLRQADRIDYKQEAADIRERHRLAAT